MKNKVLTIIVMLSILSPIMIKQHQSTIYDSTDIDIIENDFTIDLLQPKLALADEKVVDNIIPNSG